MAYPVYGQVGEVVTPNSGCKITHTDSNGTPIALPATLNAPVFIGDVINCSGPGTLTIQFFGSCGDNCSNKMVIDTFENFTVTSQQGTPLGVWDSFQNEFMNWVNNAWDSWASEVDRLLGLATDNSGSGGVGVLLDEYGQAFTISVTTWGAVDINNDTSDYYEYDGWYDEYYYYNYVGPSDGNSCGYWDGPTHWVPYPDCDVEV